jgi:hypothetical protein
MKSQEFVDAIRRLVMEAAVSDTILAVRHPPGKAPARELMELSNWFKELSDGDQQMAKRMLELTAHAAVSGFLAVLDGARTIIAQESPSDHFELRHVHGAQTDVLGGPNGDVLHELL